MTERILWSWVEAVGWHGERSLCSAHWESSPAWNEGFIPRDDSNYCVTLQHVTPARAQPNRVRRLFLTGKYDIMAFNESQRATYERNLNNSGMCWVWVCFPLAIRRFLSNNHLLSEVLQLNIIESVWASCLTVKVYIQFDSLFTKVNHLTQFCFIFVDYLYLDMRNYSYTWTPEI